MQIKVDLVSLLTITFLILKLTKVISWSWWWVFSPIIITFIICFIIAIEREI